jgi:hypothetical protein
MAEKQFQYRKKIGGFDHNFYRSLLQRQSDLLSNQRKITDFFYIHIAYLKKKKFEVYFETFSFFWAQKLISAKRHENKEKRLFFFVIRILLLIQISYYKLKIQKSTSPTVRVHGTSAVQYSVS